MMKNTKKVHFIYDAQFCGRQEIIKDIPSEEVYADNLVEQLFPKVMGITFDNNCSIYVPDDKILIEHEENFDIIDNDQNEKETNIRVLINELYDKISTLKQLMED